MAYIIFLSSRRRHTRYWRDWSSDVCSSDLVGILAAIALPTFLGQQKKGQDASAKSDARNLVSQVESCFADTQDYTKCNDAAELGTTGLDLGVADGQVEVKNAAADGYTVEAHSKSTNDFRIVKVAGGD